MSRYLPHERARGVSADTILTTTLTHLRRNAPARCLRLGLAFVFLYAAIFVSSSAQRGGHYVPAFITTLLPLRLFLPLFGSAEIGLALWLLSGKRIRSAAFLSAALLIAITVPNLADFPIIFRNIAIIAAAFALAMS